MVPTIRASASRVAEGGLGGMRAETPSLRDIAEPAIVNGAAWRALAMLWFLYVLNFLDRGLLSTLAKPIQDSLHISDSQLGLISGLYFAVFYCFIAIPVGWLADRTNRVKVLALACAIWSGATAACGLAGNFPQLVAARMIVGVGEAGGVPPSYAIITDYFPPGRRGTALAIYNLGPPIGQAFGLAAGASIAAAFGWRYAFLVLGAAGVVSALFVRLALREPPQGRFDQARSAVAVSASFWATVKAFLSRPSLVLAAFACGTTQVITYGAGAFTNLILMREKGMTLAEAAVWPAVVVAVFMSGGILASGRVIDRHAVRWKPAYALIPAISLALALPFYLGFVLAPGWPLAVAFLAGPYFLNFFYLSSAVALVQEESAPNQRVMAGALLLLIMNLMGMGIGPTFVGALSDRLRAAHPQHSLQMALLALAPLYILAVILFLVLTLVLSKEHATARESRR
jgi:MFS family permease